LKLVLERVANAVGRDEELIETSIILAAAVKIVS
jgi:hypothetical protein